MPRKKRLNEALFKRRKALAMTQNEVAQRMKVGKQTYLNWEKGQSLPKIFQMPKLRDFLEQPYEAIVEMCS